MWNSIEIIPEVKKPLIVLLEDGRVYSAIWGGFKWFSISLNKFDFDKNEWDFKGTGEVPSLGIAWMYIEKPTF